MNTSTYKIVGYRFAFVIKMYFQFYILLKVTKNKKLKEFRTSNDYLQTEIFANKA